MAGFGYGAEFEALVGLSPVTSGLNEKTASPDASV
jgi:hypothetical protein